MKANEAPEKIYVHEASAPELTENLPYHIEYTRTDAFIEKVEDYLNSQLYDWVSVTNPDQRSHPNVIPKEDFIDGFKNYIKGK